MFDAAASHGTQGKAGLRYRAARLVETRALHRADAVTTICEGLRADAIDRGVPGEKITVIPNAVDRNVFSGPGLPDHLKEAVFERFTTGSDEARGTGIGLWVVARLAEVNGGRAWVEDRVGGGASFRVVLSTTEPAEAKADPDADIWLDYEDSSRS